MQYVVLAYTDRWGIKSSVQSEQPLIEAGISCVCVMEYRQPSQYLTPLQNRCLDPENYQNKISAVHSIDSSPQIEHHHGL